MALQYWAMIALSALSVLLPGIGLFGVYRSSIAEWRAYSNAPQTAKGGEPSVGQFNVMARWYHEKMQGKPSFAVRDFVYIGVGLLFGSVASIWAVLDTALKV